MQAQKLELDRDFWQPDGAVKAMVYDSVNNRVYVGGTFTSLSPYAPFGALVNCNTERRDKRYSQPNNDVKCAIKDNNGGWFIGGNFSIVGDSARSGLAQLNSRGEVTSMFSGEAFKGNINKLLLKDSLLFVAGSYSAYGSKGRTCMVFDTLTQKTSTDFPETNGTLTKVIPDGNGGWFVCGSFTKIGDSLRTNLAHLDSLGIPDLWNPDPSGAVNDILLNGNTLYVGGAFYSVGNAVRYSLAGLDVTTGDASSWNPQISTGGIIHKFALKGVYLYVAGKFTTIGGKTRSNIAAVHITTALASNWNPGFSGTAKALVIANNTLYLAGSISSIAATTRSNIAAVSLVTGKISPWNPLPDKAVNDIQLYGPYIIAGGLFTKMDITPVTGLAFLDTITGMPAAGKPAVTGTVSSIFIEGKYLFVSGSFLKVDSALRKNFACINLSSFIVNKWKIFPDGNISLVAVSGRRVLAGGMNGLVSRNGLACINVKTGRITAWDPQMSGGVASDLMDLDEGRIMVAGSFKSIGGRNHRSLARIEIYGGSADEWDAACDSFVTVVQLHKGILYAAGAFKNIGGQARAKLASIDTSAAMATSFIAPVFDKNINDIKLTDTIICVGGTFTKVGTSSNRGFMALSINTGKRITGTMASFDGDIFCLAILNNKIYAGGSFKNEGAQATPYMAEIDRKSLDVTPWATYPDDVIYVICPGDSDMYVGGHFSKIGGEARENLAALDLRNGQLLDWAREVRVENPGIFSMILRDTVLYVGGSFDMVRINNVYNSRYSLAAFHTSTGALLSWKPKADLLHASAGNVNTMLFRDSSIYIGGSFKDIDGITRRSLAAVSPVAGKLMAWNPDANKEVNSVFYSGGNLYAGGLFDSLGGQKRAYLGAVNAATGQLQTWNPGANQRVNTFTSDGKFIYIGGYFTSLGGNARGGLARIDQTTGALDAWKPVMSSFPEIKTLIRKDSFLYAGGIFTSINSNSRKNAATFNIYTGLLSEWNPVFNNTTYTINSAGNYLFAGGSFNTVGGERCFYLASFRNTCKQAAYSSYKATACASYTINGETFKRTGVYIQRLKTEHGCDSFLSLDLKIIDPTSSIQNVTLNNCGPFILNNIAYSKSGTYSQILKNKKGCDSNIILNLKLPDSDIHFNVNTCDTFRFNGKRYDTTGTYIFNLKNRFGCDSIVTLNLIIKNSWEYHYYEVSCDPFKFDGQTYSTSGIYRKKYTDWQGCDSFLVLHLVKININNGVSISGHTLTAKEGIALYQWMDCNRDSILPADTFRSFTPTYSGSFAVKVTWNGCDSTSACYQVTLPSGLNNILEGSVIAVFPNPVRDVLKLQFSPYIGARTIRLCDVTGKINWQSECREESMDIDVSTMTKGIYILSVEMENTKSYFRVVKE